MWFVGRCFWCWLCVVSGLLFAFVGFCCCSVCVVRCSLFVVCCYLIVVVVCWLLFLFVVCWSLLAICCTLSVARCIMLFAVRFCFFVCGL